MHGSSIFDADPFHGLVKLSRLIIPPGAFFGTHMDIFKNIENFSGTDPCPGIALDAISPLSRRAYALMMRNRTKPLLKEGFINIVGAVEMLSGLEYHHDNFVRLSGQLASGQSLDETYPYHEAVAYLNRLGQLYYFARSPLVAKAGLDPAAMIPTMEKYVLFRMKHSAHRSIDNPRHESDNAQILQAMSLTRAWGKMMSLKPGAPNIFPTPGAALDARGVQEFYRKQWQTSYLTFQIYDEDHQMHLNLVLEKEHPHICAEAYSLLADVMLWERQ